LKLGEIDLVHIRKAVISDAEGISKVHVDSWRTTYKNILSSEFLASLSYKRREIWWKEAVFNETNFLFVAENDNGQIIGFVNGGKERSGSYGEYKGEVYAFYLLEEEQGKGVGSLLIKAAIDQLKLLHLNSMLIWVLEKNPSRYFYERHGGHIVDRQEVEIGGVKLHEIAYGWKNI
jgi:GNAT superfamily N-acetyltransferase